MNILHTILERKSYSNRRVTQAAVNARCKMHRRNGHIEFISECLKRKVVPTWARADALKPFIKISGFNLEKLQIKKMEDEIDRHREQLKKHQHIWDQKVADIFSKCSTPSLALNI